MVLLLCCSTAQVCHVGFKLYFVKVSVQFIVIKISYFCRMQKYKALKTYKSSKV